MILLRVRNLTIDGHLSAQRLWIKEPRATNGEGDKESVHTHDTVDTARHRRALTSHIDPGAVSRALARTTWHRAGPRRSGLGRNSPFSPLIAHANPHMPSPVIVIVTDNSHSLLLFTVNHLCVALWAVSLSAEPAADAKLME